MPSGNNQVVTRERTGIKELIRGDAFKQRIQSMFDSPQMCDRFIQIAVNATVSNPALLNCTKESFFNCLTKIAQTGLMPDGRNAHVIPYGNVATLVIDYKGFVTLAMASGMVSKIDAFIVYKNDDFSFVNGEVHHVADPFSDRGEMIGAYAMCQFKDGTKKYEVMSKKEIDSVRALSRSGERGPWKTFYEEMAKKTVFKRMQKWLPVTPNLMKAIDIDNEDYILPQNHKGPRRVKQTIELDVGLEPDGTPEDDAIEADATEEE